MADTQAPVTDSNVVDEQEPVTNDAPAEHHQPEKANYEVVFFVRYRVTPRPPSEDVTKFFNNYGVVHHVNCPENRNYAFVFMTSLNTPAEYRRTRTTISQIIQDMTPENRFYITVANSNRRNMPYQNNSYQNNYGYQNYPRPQFYPQPYRQNTRDYDDQTAYQGPARHPPQSNSPQSYQFREFHSQDSRPTSQRPAPHPRQNVRPPRDSRTDPLRQPNNRRNLILN